MVRLLLAYSLVAASTMTAATDGLKHLRTHGHHQGNHGDPSPEEAHQPRAKCTQKLGRRRRYRVVNNPYNESGVTFVASQAVPRRWANLRVNISKIRVLPAVRVPAQAQNRRHGLGSSAATNACKMRCLLCWALCRRVCVLALTSRRFAGTLLVLVQAGARRNGWISKLFLLFL